MDHRWVVLVLIAAVSHAGWNFLLKQSGNKTVFLWSLRTWALLIFGPVSLVVAAWQGFTVAWLFWGGISALLHNLYSWLLIKSYEQNDLAQAYPITRGTAPLIVLFVGWLALGERIGAPMIIGTLLIIGGIFLLHLAPRPGGGAGASMNAVIRSPWPIVVGVVVAGYTVFDKMAVARVAPVALYVCQNLGQVAVLGLFTFRNQGSATVRREWRRNWPKMFLAGLFVGLAYVLVLLVMTKVPVSRISPARESSILFGSLLGFFLLKEKFTPARAVGAVLIFVGVVLAVS